MHPNPMLEELWATRREIDREAGGDLDRLCEQTRQWAASRTLPGPSILPEDLPAYFAMLDAREKATEMHDGRPRSTSEPPPSS